MNNVIELHPKQVEAINDEAAASARREVKLVLEIAALHGIIAGMRTGCEAALAHCMHPRSIQAEHLKTAIKRADSVVSR